MTAQQPEISFLVGNSSAMVGELLLGALDRQFLTLAMAFVLYVRGIDLLPRLSDVSEQVARLSVLSLRRTMEVKG